jgi:hypothetical protein
MTSVNKASIKKDEINFEKLYMSSMEVKQEVQKTLSLFQDFFNNYIRQNQSCDSTEIIKYLNQMEGNKRKIIFSKKLTKIIHLFF